MGTQARSTGLVELRLQKSKRCRRRKQNAQRSRVIAVRSRSNERSGTYRRRDSTDGSICQLHLRADESIKERMQQRRSVFPLFFLFIEVVFFIFVVPIFVGFIVVDFFPVVGAVEIVVVIIGVVRVFIILVFVLVVFILIIVVVTVLVVVIPVVVVEVIVFFVVELVAVLVQIVFFVFDHGRRIVRRCSIRIGCGCIQNGHGTGLIGVEGNGEFSGESFDRGDTHVRLLGGVQMLGF
ncbi:conserved hypothetical protein-putative transmembrane protein [Rhodopirellula baltica SH 1]|uniref:Uncharacterized protein n=1 Tax=Rhodopirellula baltica (strain DSM 10527 / NCIMB 13988 / SH1) TaxID=243090 RepID=Q7UE47_RHOBA|nr:conserved hypothetical protein-putative transmembrane protein [Rhodopirellula baltica SH 1]